MKTEAISEARNLIGSLGTGWPILSTSVHSTIPYFGQVITQVRDVRGKQVEYFSILRHFGWSMVFGVTTEGEVLTLIQWKPGVNQGSWELPPGGIGKVPENISLDDIREKTASVLQKETGFANGRWSNLGHIIIETGKYRGATPESHGFKAHLWLAQDLVKTSRVAHAPEEMIHVLPVPLSEFRAVLDSGLFVEESAVVCAYKALERLGVISWK